ncbi:bifunctional 2-polyprenyl-6-hydroxyphenol methylase/3-demethylubiquinol 3-O-methyltransferase UbiG [Glycomyces sp. NRRL B-16210]|uniref:class I SAM-dependent methyltransferase n=1 Tax=Glycomyces sp. NRRL B-16210 TaxID=1463821 RepID=UPI0004C1FD1E|nr:class I SAM-dependent methyltransferase [Glycomyces sp. NRRL B-16210]
MEWAEEFYSRTGGWWVEAESGVGDRDRGRVAGLHRVCGPEPKRVLELGCGYGNTAAAFAEAGHEVVGVELSSRAERALAHAERFGPERMRIVHGDFYTAAVEGPFDAVVYWNGFGIGSDADQRRLLRRIAAWLAPGGTALVDVFNPLVWAGWDGDLELLKADPERGYHHELRQSTAYDPVTATAVDTWWDTAEPDRRITQRIRCYSPADLRLLLEGTGLALEGLLVGDDPLDPAADHAGNAALLRERHEYLAVLGTDGA